MLEVRHISKVYAPHPWWLKLIARTASPHPVEALRDVSIQVAAGEVVGLIGPNGAGKTTLIKCLAGLLDPTEGVISLDGTPLDRRLGRPSSRLGLMLTDDRGLYWRLTGRQNLMFFAGMAGLSRQTAAERVGQLLALVELADRDRLVFGYSSGMRCRLAIARCLLADPGLLVLDEPTRSLDPLAAARVGQLLRSLADSGRAVLLSSHRLDEVVTVCDRVEVLVEGSIRRSLTRPSDGNWASGQLSSVLEEEASRP